MKGKRLTYILVLSATTVWAIVFYRIYDSGRGEDVFAPHVQTVKTTYKSLEDYQLKDTFSLTFNYRDPFLGEEIKFETSELRLPVAENYSSNIRSAEPLPAVPATDWGFIQYTGYVMNPSSKRIVVIMSINGKEYMLSEGQSADGVTLIRSFRDSVKVSYKQKTKIIKAQ